MNGACIAIGLDLYDDSLPTQPNSLSMLVMSGSHGISLMNGMRLCSSSFSSSSLLYLQCVSELCKYMQRHDTYMYRTKKQIK